MNIGRMNISRIARPAARLIVLDPIGRVLLFRFAPGEAPAFWATPGGAVDPEETFAQAARRELREETGHDLDCGAEVAQRRVEFTTIEGVDVWSDERYFLVRVTDCAISVAGHTALERSVMTQHRWWTCDDLRATDETVFPEDIVDMIENLLIAAKDRAS